MSALAKSLARLIAEPSRLPDIGPDAASRRTFLSRALLRKGG